MGTTKQAILGGYARFANRWLDAGYAGKAPGSVTLVYLAICRWADNATLIAEQPISRMARVLGTTENRVREATRVLEAWGVVERMPAPSHNAVPRWRLLELQRKAPPLPARRHDPTKMGRSDPTKMVGMDAAADTSQTGEHGASDPTKTDPTKTDPTKTDPTKMVPTKPVGSDPTKMDPTKTGRTYQTKVNQTESRLTDQTETNISSDDLRPSLDIGAADGKRFRFSPQKVDTVPETTKAQRSRLVSALSATLNTGDGFAALSQDQQHRIYRGEPLAGILTTLQADFVRDAAPELLDAAEVPA